MNQIWWQDSGSSYFVGVHPNVFMSRSVKEYAWKLVSEENNFELILRRKFSEAFNHTYKDQK